MLTLFREKQEPKLEHYQAKDETVNGEPYCAFLTDELKMTIGMQRRGRLSQTVILQHDNTRKHTNKKIIETSKI